VPAELGGRRESSGRGGSLVCRPARLVTVTVMKSPSSFEVFVEVFSSGMSIYPTIMLSNVIHSTYSCQHAKRKSTSTHGT